MKTITLNSPIKVVKSSTTPTTSNLAKGEIGLQYDASKASSNSTAKIYFNAGSQVCSINANMANAIIAGDGGLPTASQVAAAIAELKTQIAGVWHLKGTKDTTAEILALTSAEIGDVWHSKEDGSEWVCTKILPVDGSSDCWEEIGTVVDLTAYYTKTEVDNKLSVKETEIANIKKTIAEDETQIATNKTNIQTLNEYVGTPSDAQKAGLSASDTASNSIYTLVATALVKATDNADHISDIKEYTDTNAVTSVTLEVVEI